MARKKDYIKEIQIRLELKSFEKANKIYNVIQDINKDFLKNKGSLKLEGVGIIKIGDKKARKITVPKLKDKVFVPDRKGLFFKADKKFETDLNS